MIKAVLKLGKHIGLGIQDFFLDDSFTAKIPDNGKQQGYHANDQIRNEVRIEDPVFLLGM